MMQRIKLALISLSLCLLGSAIIHYGSGMDFWLCMIIVAAALVLNGLLADREDRGKFND